MTKDNPNVRELALYVLTEVTDRGEYSNHVLKNVLEKYQYMEKRDRAFLSRLCEGTLEQLIRIDDVLNRFSKVPVKKMKPVIRGILRLGVYQLLFMDSVPDAAVCNESVKLATRKGFYNLKGFVNGVLRSIAREKDKALQVTVFHAPVDREKMAGCVPGEDGGAAARCFSGTGVHLHPLQQLPDLAGGAADTAAGRRGSGRAGGLCAGCPASDQI